MSNNLEVQYFDDPTSHTEAVEPSVAMESIKRTGSAVMHVVRERGRFAAINLGELVVTLAHEARDDFGR